jgi:hypothetical protein
MRKEYAGGALGVTLATAINSTATSIELAGAGGWPDGAVAPFVLKLQDAVTGSEEKVLCSSRSGNVCTVQQRGYDGTAAASFGVGSFVAHVYDAVSASDALHHDGTVPLTGDLDFNGNRALRLAMPAFRIYSNATQPVATSTFTQVSFELTDFDPGTLAAAGGGSVTATPGLWLLTASVAFDFNSGKKRRTVKLLDGTSDIARTDIEASSSGDTVLQCTAIYNVASTATLRVEAWQNSGNSLDVRAGYYRTWFHGVKLGVL